VFHDDVPTSEGETATSSSQTDSASCAGVTVAGPMPLQTQDDAGSRRLRSALARMSPGTIRAYNLALRTFATWAATALGCGNDTWWDVLRILVTHGKVVTGDGIDRYGTEPGDTLAPAPVAQRLAAVRWALGVLYEVGTVNWTVKVKAPKVIAYRDTRGPTLHQVQAVQAAADQEPGLLGLRDAVVVRALFVLGLRRGEATGLRCGDWARDVPGLWVMGKGRHERELVAVPNDLAARLDAYLKARGPVDTSAPLLATPGPRSDGRPLPGDAIRRVLARLSARAGLERTVRPHGLRHAAITNALDIFNGDVRRVARFSRHRKVDTVSLYDDRRQDLAGDVANALETLVENAVPTSPSTDDIDA